MAKKKKKIEEKAKNLWFLLKHEMSPFFTMNDIILKELDGPEAGLGLYSFSTAQIEKCRKEMTPLIDYLIEHKYVQRQHRSSDSFLLTDKDMMTEEMHNEEYAFIMTMVTEDFPQLVPIRKTGEWEDPEKYHNYDGPVDWD